VHPSPRTGTSPSLIPANFGLWTGLLRWDRVIDLNPVNVPFSGITQSPVPPLAAESQSEPPSRRALKQRGRLSGRVSKLPVRKRPDRETGWLIRSTQPVSASRRIPTDSLPTMRAHAPWGSCIPACLAARSVTRPQGKNWVVVVAQTSRHPRRSPGW